MTASTIIANEINKNKIHIPMSGLNAYNLLSGALTLTGTALKLNAIVPFANGVDANGTKNTILTKNETVSGLTLTQGKNYVYAKNDGTYGVTTTIPKYGKDNPASGDFYDVLKNKWYTSAGVEITESRNYLDAIVHADAGRQPTYIEQLPKIEYKDIIKANEYQGKNACTAWVNFDGTTTPPTIRNSFNVSSVVSAGGGYWDIYSDSIDFTKIVSATATLYESDPRNTNWDFREPTTNRIRLFVVKDDGAAAASKQWSIQIFGGRN